MAWIRANELGGEWWKLGCESVSIVSSRSKCGQDCLELPEFISPLSSAIFILSDRSCSSFLLIFFLGEDHLGVPGFPSFDSGALGRSNERIFVSCCKLFSIKLLFNGNFKVLQSRSHFAPPNTRSSTSLRCN